MKLLKSGTLSKMFIDYNIHVDFNEKKMKFNMFLFYKNCLQKQKQKKKTFSQQYTPKCVWVGTRP